MANRNFASSKQMAMRAGPVRLDCSFNVDSSTASGISSLNGPAIQAVLMHSVAATPSSPNPEAGIIILRLADPYNRVLNVSATLRADNSGTPLTSTTIHVAYIITALGSATAAQWQAKGLPIGITPALGVAFVATATGSIGGSAAVQIAAATGSGIANIEILGQPNQSVSPNPSANQGYGAQIILQCRDYAGALANPADGAAINLEVYLDNSSVVTG